MTSDTRSAFETALKALLDTIGTTFVVSLERKAVDQFTTDDFPLVRINEQEGVTSHRITSARTTILRYQITIAVKQDVTEAVLQGYVESITDKVDTDPQISNTCDYCIEQDQDDPEDWADTGYKVRNLYYSVMLRRNY